MLFKNRTEAARQLARKLAPYRAQHPLVLGVPRGAVPMAALIAEALEGDLDVVLVHKLRAPWQPELAIGAVDELGQVHLSDYAQELGVTDEYLESEAKDQVATLKRRRQEYTPIHPPIDPGGRVVIVVDDGIATGASMLAAIRAIRAKSPQRLIVAAAVAPPDTVRRLATEADDVVVLETPTVFRAIGEFFEDFGQVSDEDVIEALRHRRPSPP
jgi:putative phosphoribosyl transferase